MFRPLLLCVLTLLLVSVPTKLISQESCDAAYIASDIHFSDTHNLSQDAEAAAKAALIGQCFNNPINGDIAGTVQRVLRDVGYLRATALAPSMTVVDASHYPQRASLTFTVHEGSRSPVQEIEITGNNLIDADEVRSVIQVRLGEFLDMSKVRASSRTIQSLYRANGFSKMTFKQIVEFSAEPKVRVIFQINEGPRS